jgi:hypothetical protein
MAEIKDIRLVCITDGDDRFVLLINKQVASEQFFSGSDNSYYSDIKEIADKVAAITGVPLMEYTVSAKECERVLGVGYDCARIAEMDIPATLVVKTPRVKV